MGSEATAVTAIPGFGRLNDLLTRVAFKYNIPNRRRQRPPLNQRQRKAVGTVLTVFSVIVWATIAMWLYEWFLVGASPIWHLIFFVGFGMAWIFPARIIIRWMAKPDA